MGVSSLCSSVAACVLLILVFCGVESKSVASRFGDINRNTRNFQKARCYDRVGCFSGGAPFYSPERLLYLLPNSPDDVKTMFRLYTRQKASTAVILDARHPDKFTSEWPDYKSTRPTKIIVHGFVDNVDINAWINQTKDELLVHSDVNVVIIDWSAGNQPPYTQATGNTRLVGAQIADLIKTIMQSTKQPPSAFHIIGHSLGAHIAGYAGERIPGLARITGLDPAGPYFENTDPAVRLDTTDAVFVDTIHSDAKSLLQLGYGMKQQIGHADYYPNNGYEQPGCDKDPVTKLLEGGLIAGGEEIVACNHLRSYKFFIESINSKCPFMAYPCDSEDDFTAGTCMHCSEGTCGKMGYHADDVIPATPTKFYLTTGDEAPFCQFHLQLTVRLMASDNTERGQMSAMLHGDKGSTGWMVMNDSPRDFEGGAVHNFSFGVPADIGHVSSVEFSWHHTAGANPFKWNIFGWRHPKIAVDEVDIDQAETGDHNSFCITSDQAKSVETDGHLMFDSVCTANQLA